MEGKHWKLEKDEEKGKTTKSWVKRKRRRRRRKRRRRRRRRKRRRKKGRGWEIRGYMPIINVILAGNTK